MLDIVRPARDALRSPDAPDPLGGVLNDGDVLAPVAAPAETDLLPDHGVAPQATG